MKSITESLFRCACCVNSFPAFYRHEHHRIPQSAGGPDTPENLLELCPGCHDALHKVAYKLLGKANVAMVKDTLGFIFKDNLKAQQTCLELAIYVRDSMVKAREEGLDPNHIVTVATSLQKKHKDVFAICCQDARVSQEAYLRMLILHDLKRHYPNLVGNVIEENQTVRVLKKRGNAAN